MTDAERDARLIAFYRERLLRLTDTARADGRRWLDTALDPGAASYYITCEPTASHVVSLPRAGMSAALRTLWQVHHGPELASLAEPILALAADIHQPDAEPGDVSPFIYAMF